MKILWLVISIFWTAINLTAGEWHVTREIIGEADATTVAAVTLDDHVFDNSQPAWADVRVIDGSGREVPRVILPEQAYGFEDRHIWHKATLKNLEQLPDGGLAVICEIKHDNVVALTQVTVNTPLRDYEQTLTVFIQGPEGGWLPVREAEPLFDYSRYANVRKESVELPALTNRVFKLVIGQADDKVFSTYTSMTEMTEMTEEHDGTQTNPRVLQRYSVQNRPFRIDSVSFRDTEKVAVADLPLTKRVVVPGSTITEDKALKRTTLTVATGRRPLTGLVFDPDQQNFARNAEIEYFDQGSWRVLAKGQLTRSRLPGIPPVDQLEIKFTEKRVEQLRVQVHDDDNPPLTFGQNGMTLVHLAYRVLFIAEKGERYQLTYGNPEITDTPVYENNVLAYLNSGQQATAWTLAAATEGVVVYGATVQTRRFFASHGMLLISLVVMVALGVLIVRAVRHVDKDKKE